MSSERRHRQPGRRDSDAGAYSGAAFVESVVEDRVFPAWKKEDVIKWLTILTLAGGIFVGTAAWLSARYATRGEIKEQIRPVVDSIGTITDTLNSFNARLRKIEDNQPAAAAARDLVGAMARLQCLDYARQNSMSLPDAAGVSCDSLLRRVTAR